MKDSNTKAITPKDNPVIITEDQIKAFGWVHYLLLALLLILISFSIVNILLPQLFWNYTDVVDYPLHSSIEAVGAIAAILVAFMPLQVLFGKYKSSYIFLSAGFLAMGLCDLFHSFYKISHGFVFTHSIALLAGGFFFALFVLPWKINADKVKSKLLLVVGSITILLGIISLLNQDIFPEMVHNNVFTPTANRINLIAGLFFLISAIKIISIYIQEKNLGVLLLLFTAVSSAIVGFTFQYSEAWSDSWWLWHIIRLIAFLAFLGYLFLRIQTINNEKNEALQIIEEKQKQLMESEERFSLVNEATSHGLWDWDVFNNVVYFSPVWKMQVGYRDEELENDFGNWVKLLHPEDKERMLKAVDDYLKNPSEKFIVEFRFRHKAGYYVWIHNEAASVKDEKGNVTRMFGAHTDITAQKEAEELIKQSEKKFKGLFENDPSAILIADPLTGLVHDVNPAAERLMEMSRDELIGLHQSKLHPEDIMQEQVEKFNKLQGQPNVSVNSEVMTKTGKRKQVQIKASMVEIEKKPYILGIFHDISKLVEGQQKLKQSEEKHRSIFESATDAFIIASMEGKIVEANPSACKMYGYAYDEMIGKTATELIHPDHHYKFSEFIKDIQDKGFYEGETEDVRKDQTTFFTEFHGSLINFNNQVHMLAVIRDVSEKKQQENELILKNLVYESSVAANSTADLAGNLTSVNQSFLNIWGYKSEDEVLGQPIPIFIKYEEEAGKILAGLTTEGKWQGTFTALKKDGSTFIAQANASILYNSNGKKIGFQSSVFDVTEAVESEQKLIKSEEKFRNLFNSVSIPLAHVKEDGKMESINNRFKNHLGYSLEDIPSIDQWWEKAYPDKKYREWVLKNWDEAVQYSIENGTDIKSDVYNVTCKNGEVRQIIISGITFGKDVLATFIDVTEQRKAEEAIIREKEFSETVVNALPGIFYLFNENGKFIKWNKMLEELSGFSPQEIAEKSPLDYFADYHKDIITNSIESVFKEGESSVEGDLMVKGKTPTPFYFTGRTIEIEGKPHLLGVALDISQRKKIEKEKEKAQEQLKVSIENLRRSNEELERFAYVASHDLQEPLRMVASYTQLLQRRYKGQLDERADKYIYYAVDGANRMQNLINDLLDFSRISTRGDEFTQTDTNEVVKNALKNLHARIDETGAQIKIGNLPLINADSSQIERLFLNLIGNALKFSKPDEKPLIEINAQKQKEKWLFSIKDNGIGIDEKFNEKVFVIFQRLHGAAQYKGTGIGLAICKRIVQRHEGEIWFESEENKGTTFFFTLKN
ncbi:MAG: PAS domain S-box protein [Candidatus Kapabacteria bacterium]|nr:PAS domain S-box protein [Candidatus Kapabacteria bacterium]